MLQNYKVKPSNVYGVIDAPPSKSHTIRAILFASLAHGESIIKHYLHSPDTRAMIDACTQLGANIKVLDDELHIIGVAGLPKQPENIIDAGNSGMVLRFIGAVGALINGYTVISGDHSIRYNRPVQPLLDGLQKLGVFAVSTKNDGYAPIIVKGPWQSGITELDGTDSQPVSGLLIAATQAEGNNEIQINNPGEIPWVGLTLDWFDRLGIAYENHDFKKFIIAGKQRIDAFTYSVPGDFSSISFPLVSAIITDSELTIRHVDMNDPQGDKQLIYILQKMGANIDIDEANNTLIVRPGNDLKAVDVDINMNNLIDAVPILAVAACYARGETRIVGAANARNKESDRLAAITNELRKMGADIEEHADGLVIHGQTLSGTAVNTYCDHRIVMSLAVAALGAMGDTLVEDVTFVAKSYPDFLQDMQSIGADIQLIA